MNLPSNFQIPKRYRFKPSIIGIILTLFVFGLIFMSQDIFSDLSASNLAVSIFMIIMFLYTLYQYVASYILDLHYVEWNDHEIIYQTPFYRISVPYVSITGAEKYYTGKYNNILNLGILSQGGEQITGWQLAAKLSRNRFTLVLPINTLSSQDKEEIQALFFLHNDFDKPQTGYPIPDKIV